MAGIDWIVVKISEMIISDVDTGGIKDKRKGELMGRISVREFINELGG